jgi:cyclopropane-fatty-acyl-phospholipid synthase
LGFELALPNEASQLFGQAPASFGVVVNTARGKAALASFDELRIGEAYLNGDLDVTGDMAAALRLRKVLEDRHPLSYLWSTWGRRLVFGQQPSDAKWIAEHYDHEPDFYLTFLDRDARCYSHGYFESDDETLETAIGRKLDAAIENCRIRPGSRVLDIGAGWGAFTQRAGQIGAHVTSLTISKESEAYVADLIARERLTCKVVREHFLSHRSEEPYDAIVNLGVTEHLPDYDGTIAQYWRLLKPGGRVFLDACGAARKFGFSSFVRRHVWPGNASPLHLPDYTRALARTQFELVSVTNDRHNYMLTTRRWAENLDRARDAVVRRWGERLYRRFRLYLWGCVQAFEDHDLTAYRLLLERPK